MTGGSSFKLKNSEILCTEYKWTTPEMRQKILEAFQFCLAHSLESPSDIKDQVFRTTAKQCVIIKDCASWDHTPSAVGQNSTWLYKESLWQVLIC